MKTEKKHLPLTKIVSFVLSILIVFYVIPTSAFAAVLNPSEHNASSTQSSEITNRSADTGNSVEPQYVGIESYFPTTSHSAGSGGAVSLNLFTGQIMLAVPTLTTTDALFGFTPTLVYNSSLAGVDVTSANSPSVFSTSYMPLGFKLNIQETISKINSSESTSGYYYALYDADGTLHEFYPSSDGTVYCDSDGLRLTLTVSGDNLQIKDTANTVRTYSSLSDNATAWHLTSITDEYGNQLIFEFNTSNQPTKVIVKPNGMANIEMLSFLYNDNGKLCAVYNSASKDSVILNYSNGNLSKVRYCYGNENTTVQDVESAYSSSQNTSNVIAYATATYTYNADGYITEITDIEADKYIQYSISSGKLIGVSEYGGDSLGQQVSYAYFNGYTDARYTGENEILNDEDDILTRYIFDEFGRAVNIYSMLSDGEEVYSATVGVYDNSPKSRNSIKSNTVFNGIDTDDLVESTANSADCFAEIENGEHRQILYNEENVASLTESNADVEYIISGLGKANSISQAESAEFSIGVDVYYYQGTGVPDEVVEYRWEFSDIADCWQFVTGRFSCALPSTEDTDYRYVRKIELVCSYYGHPDVGTETALASFNNITFAEAEIDNGYDYEYDSETGNLTKKYNSVYFETYEYNSENKLSRIENSYDEVYSYDYRENSSGSIKYSRYYKGEEIVSLNVYTYDTYGLLIKSENFGATGETELDSLSRISTEYVYYITGTTRIFGTLLSETDSVGSVIEYIVDETNGRLLKTKYSDGTGYNYYYADDGQLISVRPAVLSGGNMVDQAERVEYDYDNAGRLIGISTNSTDYEMSYDSYGNLLSVGIGERTLASYEYYSNNGKLKKVLYGNGFSEEYAYNALELLSDIWYNYSDGTRVQAYKYTYNYDGTLARIDNLIENTYQALEYDNFGRLISVSENNADATDYRNKHTHIYNDDNVITSSIYGITYTYSSLTYLEEFTTLYQYNERKYLETETLTYIGDNFEINHTYDSFNRLSQIERDLADFDYTTEYFYYTNGENTSTRIRAYLNTINGIQRYYTYTYDAKGNITNTTVNGNTYTYTYDDLGQLTKEVQGNTTYTYTYDNAGNITGIEMKKLNSGGGIIPTPWAITPNPPLYFTETHTLGYTNTEWGDLLTSYDGTAITYDEIGNPLSYYNGSSYTFSWEARDLVSATKGSKNITFVYNDDGIRTGKTVNGVEHIYYLSGSQIMAELWEDKMLVYLYDASGSPMGMLYRTESMDVGRWSAYWFEKNLQGDVVAVFSESGVKLAEYTYTNAWGDHTVTYSGTTPAQYNPFRYRGYYYDTDLGMYYLQSRYYDPATARFINADVYISTGYGIIGNNMFAYCNNNPIVYSDHEGTDISYEGNGQEEDYNPNNDNWNFSGGGAIGGMPGNSGSSSGAGSNGGSGGSGGALPPNGAVVNSSTALDWASSFLGNNYTEASSGRFVSQQGNGFRQVRFDISTENNHAGAPHFNFEIYIPDSMHRNRFTKIANSHVFITDI